MRDNSAAPKIFSINQTHADGTPTVIDTDKYEIIRFIGRGNWGSVYKAKNRITGEDCAIKVFDPNETAKTQMQYRNLTEEDVMHKEHVGSHQTYSNLAPRILEKDKNGKLFIVMDYYESTLEEKIHSNEPEKNRRHLDCGMEIRQAVRYIHQSIHGISELHARKRAHGDIKPDNFVVTGEGLWEKVLANDMGTSSYLMHGFPNAEHARDNMGSIYYRAPELNKPKSHPDENSDVYSLGIMTTLILTGKIPLENELATAQNPVEIMQGFTAEQHQKYMNTSIKHAPRQFRKFLKKATAYYSWERFKNAAEMEGAFEEIVKRMDAKTYYGQQFKKWTARGLATVAFAGLVFYGATHSPPPTPALPIPKMRGELYLTNGLSNNKINFTREEIPGLSYNTFEAPFSDMPDGVLQRFTKNTHAAYLLKTYRRAFDLERPKDITTKAQYDLMAMYSDPDEQRMMMGFSDRLFPIARSIEVALAKNIIDGQIDLEDACVYARLGPEKLAEAKKVSGSQEYALYRNALYANGTKVIPDNEQKFINTWLSMTRLN